MRDRAAATEKQSSGESATEKQRAELPSVRERLALNYYGRENGAVERESERERERKKERKRAVPVRELGSVRNLGF